MERRERFSGYIKTLYDKHKDECFYSRDCGCFNISHNAYHTINKLKNKGKSSNKGENISSVSVSTGTNGVTNSAESDGVVEFSYLRYTAKGRRNI
ncbi:PIR Superfamily Protein [Plasmodium ovale wallikeri]|uniref:PIR Superfamily Protein n=1 Tax=Plasmodium ovale wallikeri TaxID=864142 RepID=A0A1A9APB9_PLAOA|nr:PIR Superfamily Protein [Plasmodium ovale wallikeri]